MNNKVLIEFHRAIADDIDNGVLTLDETKRIRRKLGDAITKGKEFNPTTAEISVIRQSLDRRLTRLFKRGVHPDDTENIRYAKHIIEHLNFEWFPDID